MIVNQRERILILVCLILVCSAPSVCLQNLKGSAREKAEKDRPLRSARDRAAHQGTAGGSKVVPGGICRSVRRPPDIRRIGREWCTKPDHSGVDDVLPGVRPDGFGTTERGSRTRS